MATLQSWSWKKFGDIDKELKMLRRKLEMLLKQNNPADTSEIKNTYARLDEILLREELMWLQRSRISWLREGDRNTNFFHRKASARAKKNKIRRLKKRDGSYTENADDEMKVAALDFFRRLYKKDDSVEPQDILNLIDSSVSQEMNEELLKE